MFGFLVKKAFFDLWDNLFRVLLMNLGFLVLVAGGFSLLMVSTPIPALAVALAAVFAAALAVYAGAVSRMASEIADYRQPGFAEFWEFLKDSAGSSLLFALTLVLYFGVVFLVAMPFYAGMKSFAALAAFALLFWATVFVVLASQYFLPLRSRLDRKFRKLARKSFLLLLDNPGHSLGIFIGALVALALSVFTGFLLPGPAGIILWWNDAFKLRLYKYDWLEQNPGGNRKKIPWDALLVDDRERVGKRTLKGMIFPWKE